MGGGKPNFPIRAHTQKRHYYATKYYKESTRVVLRYCYTSAYLSISDNSKRSTYEEKWGMDERVSDRGQIRSYCVHHGRRKAEVTRLNKAKPIFRAKTGAIPTFMKALFLVTVPLCKTRETYQNKRESSSGTLLFCAKKRGEMQICPPCPVFPLFLPAKCQNCVTVLSPHSTFTYYSNPVSAVM